MKKSAALSSLATFALFSGILTATPASADPVSLEFDTLPPPPWTIISSGGESSVADGILTIDAPRDHHEMILWHPDGEWHESVDNSRGWWIETRLKVDPVTEAFCNDRGPVQVWAHDHVNLTIIGFSTDRICLAYPDSGVEYLMDTTDQFHTYRIESKLNNVRVFVDGVLRIDHTLTRTGGGSDILMFGDGYGGMRSLSYWDYFRYETFPNRPPNCSAMRADISGLWPPNGKYHNISVSGATDADGDNVQYTIEGVTSDERGNRRRPDAEYVPGEPSSVRLRAARDGSGDGRVYAVSVTASDGRATCTSRVTVGVPHRVNASPIDSGQAFGIL